MGQYYKPCFLVDDWQKTKDNGKNLVAMNLCAWDFGNGAKLMEHSYFENCFVGCVELLLKNKPSYFVWCGDYSDELVWNEEKGKFELDKNNGTVYDSSICHFLPYLIENHLDSIGVVLKRIGLDSLTDTDKEDLVYKTIKAKYLINYTKKEYVDLEKCSKKSYIHPLPLLTCSGNGLGGGDYHGDDMEHVGVWAYDKIGLSDIVGEEFNEIVTNFNEN